MYVVLFLMIFSVFIRRFIPARGFLWDKDIDALTLFGNTRKIELRNFEGASITIAKESVQGISTVQPETVVPRAEGVDLGDIKGKTYKEVDTNYMYGNVDDSDESLADTLRKGGL